MNSTTDTTTMTSSNNVITLNDDDDGVASRIEQMESLVEQLQEENRQLRLLLLSSSSSSNTNRVNENITTSEDTTSTATTNTVIPNVESSNNNNNNNDTQQILDNDTIQRYSRQILLIGIHGQQLLQQSKVLVIGAGGIGSTVLYYLAGAGIGLLDIMDHDIVEISNLHRQIIHQTQIEGTSQSQSPIYKAISAQQTLLRFNPMIQCHAICEQLTTQNAMKYLIHYDVIIDATDNVISRYIINDACVFLHKPLISGSAITTQGQLTIYRNLPNNDDCCYRCMYPNPHHHTNNNNATTANECQNCNDAGVLGPVPGLIGILQAMETIKLLTATFNTTTGSTGFKSNTTTTTLLHDKLFMYDSMSCSFMTITKPKKNPNCVVCGDHPTITTMENTYHDLQHGSRTTTTFMCPITVSPSTKSHHPSSNMDDNDDSNISCIDYYRTIRSQNVPHILLDVRNRIQYDICSLKGSINIPLDDIVLHPNTNTKEDIVTSLWSKHTTTTTTTTLPIYCICRRGIASREAVRILLSLQQNNSTVTTTTTTSDTTANNTTTTTDETKKDCQNPHHNTTTAMTTATNTNRNPSRLKIYNIVGGLVAWQQHVDPTFPKY